MTIAADAAIVAIHICATRGEDLVAVDDADLVAGQGVRGDRRFSLHTRPEDQLTLVEEEALVAAMRDAKVDLPLWASRRNIVTRGVALNHLVGRRFVVGGAVVRGVELCEPCSRLTRLSSSAFSRALVHRGGLRAEIVESGRARVGDAVRSA